MEPVRSYTIWFSQRTGSSLLTTALAATGVAGVPEEWLLVPPDVSLLDHYGVPDAAEWVATLRQRGSTPNGVFGAKVSWYEPRLRDTFALLRELPGCPPGASRPELWECAFPHHHHIFMTRRNKVRLAVSWWRAIRSHAWHNRMDGEDQDRASRRTPDVDADYDFDAITQLIAEAVMREAGIQDFLSEAGIIPLTLVYEDFVLDYDRTVRRVLHALDLDPMVTVPEPAFYPTVDEVAEAWIQRYREESQVDWVNVGW